METLKDYNSIHDGPAIDAAVTRASEGGAIDASIQAKPNLNLLDNWYFGNPVNQRGQTEYSGAGYCIDRWFAGDNKVTMEDDGILVTCNVALSIFRQYLEFAKLLSGKVITFSVDAEIISGRWFLTDMSYFSAAHNDQPINNGITSYSFPVNNSSAQGSAPAIGLFSSSAGSQIKVRSIKLELGSQQTLAHQENGVWVLNEIPDYGEQLRRCQRYQLVINSNSTTNCYIGTGVANSSTTARVFVPTPVSLRTKPVITVTGVWALSNGLGGYTVGTIAVGDLAINGVHLVLSGTSGLTAGQSVMLRGNELDAKIILDANL